MTVWQWVAGLLVVTGSLAVLFGVVAVAVGTWISTPDDDELDGQGRWVHEDRGDR